MGINRFVHSMYDPDEDAGTTDIEYASSEPDWDFDDDHDRGFCSFAHGHMGDDNEEEEL